MKVIRDLRLCRAMVAETKKCSSTWQTALHSDPLVSYIIQYCSAHRQYSCSFFKPDAGRSRLTVLLIAWSSRKLRNTIMAPDPTCSYMLEKARRRECSQWQHKGILGMAIKQLFMYDTNAPLGVSFLRVNQRFLHSPSLNGSGTAETTGGLRLLAALGLPLRDSCSAASAASIHSE